MSVKISVVTPSYNQARFLEETIRSVLSQRDQIHEYFVLDGGSTDGSVEIIKKYADKIDWWMSEKDKGQSDAIHRGFQKATGNFLYWINSDDLVLPGAIALVREALDAHPQWDILTGYHVRINGDSQIVSYHNTPPETPSQFTHGIQRVCQQTCFFRRALYEKVGGLKLDLHCVLDTELWARMTAVGAQWGHIPNLLGAYRWHDEAKMLGTKYQIKREQERAWLAKEYPQYAGGNLTDSGYLLWYRIAQIVSGRRLTAIHQTRANRGKHIFDVFKLPE